MIDVHLNNTKYLKVPILKLNCNEQDDEEEDDEIERLIKAAEKERAALLEKPIPAPPPR